MSLPFSSIKDLKTRSAKVPKTSSFAHGKGQTIQGDNGYNPMVAPRPVGPIRVERNSEAQMGSNLPNAYPTLYKHLAEESRMSDMKLRPDINPIERTVVQQGGLQNYRIAPKTADELRGHSSKKDQYTGRFNAGSSSYKAPTASSGHLNVKQFNHLPQREIDLDVAQRYPIEAGPLEGLVGVRDTQRIHGEDTKYVGTAVAHSGGGVIQHDYEGVLHNPQQLAGQFGLNVVTNSAAQNNQTVIPEASETQRGFQSSYNGPAVHESASVNYMAAPDHTQRNSTASYVQGNAIYANQGTQNVVQMEAKETQVLHSTYTSQMNASDKRQAQLQNMQTPGVTGRQGTQTALYGNIGNQRDDVYISNVQSPDPTNRGQNTTHYGEVSGVEHQHVYTMETPDYTQRGADNNYYGNVANSGTYLELKPTVEMTGREMFGESGHMGEMNGQSHQTLQLMQTPSNTQREGTTHFYLGDPTGHQHNLMNMQTPDMTGRNTIKDYEYSTLGGVDTAAGYQITKQDAAITHRQTTQSEQAGILGTQNEQGAYTLSSQEAKITQRLSTQAESHANPTGKDQGAYGVTAMEAEVTQRETLKNAEGGHAHNGQDGAYTVTKHTSCPTKREETSVEYSGNPEGQKKNKSYQDAYHMEVRNKKGGTEHNQHVSCGNQPRIEFVKAKGTRKNKMDTTNKRKPVPMFNSKRS
jgi:hypothetical protein